MIRGYFLLCDSCGKTIDFIVTYEMRDRFFALCYDCGILLRSFKNPLFDAIKSRKEPFIASFLEKSEETSQEELR